MDYDSNRLLVERTLDKTVAQMFLRCRLGLADWDFDQVLRTTLQQPEYLEKIKDIIKRYDTTIELAKDLTISEKYKILYKLSN